MATNMSYNSTPISWGGGYTDPAWEYGKAYATAMNPPQGTGISPQMTQYLGNQASAYLQASPIGQRNSMMGSLSGLLGSLKGSGGGGANLGSFDDLYKQASGSLLESLRPGQEQAQTALKNRALAEGGAGALSSGQYMNALNQLNTGQQATEQGMLGSLYQQLYSPWASGTASMANSANSFQAQLIQSILGPLFQSMFQG